MRRRRGKSRYPFGPTWLRRILTNLDRPRWFTGHKSGGEIRSWHLEPLTPMDVLRLLAWQACLFASVLAAGLLFAWACEKVVVPPDRIFHEAMAYTGLGCGIAWGEIRAAEKFLEQRITGRTAKRNIPTHRIIGWLEVPSAGTQALAIALLVPSAGWLLYDWLAR